jgi:hypothetical protein
MTKPRSDTQPLIPTRTSVPLSWNTLSVEQRQEIMKAAEIKAGRCFKAPTRYKIMYRGWEHLGLVLRDDLYELDWKKILQSGGAR